MPHGNSGRKSTAAKLSGYTGVVDDELRMFKDEIILKIAFREIISPEQNARS